MFKKNVRSIKLINCQVTLKRIRREKYSEQLTTDQSEALNDRSNVESKRKQSKVSLKATFMAGHDGLP